MYTNLKRALISVDLFQRHGWSRNPEIQLGERHTLPQPTKVTVSVTTLLSCLDGHLCAKNIRYKLIPSKDIDEQRILQSDWIRGTPGHTQSKVVVSYATFPR